MAWYDWNPSLDIHVDAMNDEHKTLIDLMNRLHSQAANGEPKAVLDKTLTDLLNFTQKHFADEERYMESISYPEISSHKIIHQQLLEKLSVHHQAFLKGPGTVSDEVFSFLKMWLNAHIKGIDIKYGEHSKTYKKSA